MKLLSLDGGGIRGLWQLEVLATLEEELRRAPHPRIGSTLRGCFDLVAGTSVGSLVACGLACGFPLADLKVIALRFGPAVFKGWWGKSWRTLRGEPAHDSADLHKALRGIFGDRRFGDLDRLTLVPAYDRLRARPVVLRSWNARAADMRVWEVCAASSSAPTYFRARRQEVDGQEMLLIDGGMGANNPEALAITAALKAGHDPKQIYSVAVGTGKAPAFSSTDSLGLLEWAPRLPETFMDAASGFANDIARDLCLAGHHHRLQEPMLNEVRGSMDDASEGHMQALIDDGQKAAGRMKTKIRLAAASLRE